MKTITKSDLAYFLHKEGFTLHNAHRATDSIFKIMAKQLSQGNEIRIRGLAQFTIKEQKARSAHNLQTNQQIQLPKRKVVKVKINKQIQQSLNQ